MGEADARAARAQTFINKLADPAELSSMMLGPYNRVVDSCITINAVMRRGNGAAGEMPYIGPADRQPLDHATRGMAQQSHWLG